MGSSSKKYPMNIEVKPSTTYKLIFWVKGKDIRYVGGGGNAVDATFSDLISREE